MARVKEIRLEIKKLDRRYTGYPDFMYYVCIKASHTAFRNRERDNLFFEWREWCWQTWGASKEVDEWVADNYFLKSQILPNQSNFVPISHNKNWCWKHDMDAKNRIYLADDQELVLFKLRWE